jgi:hypothetical protein
MLWMLRLINSAQGKEQSAAEKFATEMANVHNTLIRGLNSIILQAPNVKEPQDVKDFMKYAEIWHTLIHEHHTTVPLAPHVI